MSAFAGDRFATGLAVAASVDVVVFGITWLVARRLGRFNVVDVTWGLAILAMTATAFAWSTDAGGNGTRRALVLVMTAAWAMRLAWHIGIRGRGHGEDPRYTEILRRAPGSAAAYALRRVFLPQAVIAFVISMPLQVAMYQRGSHSAVAVGGAVVWLVGLGLETVADTQLARFIRHRADPAQVMDRGLWRYSRHPNYFGEALLWFGLWLPAAGDWRGIATVASPLIVTYLVGFATGKPLLEKGQAARKPAYADYMARTSGFLPLPPKRPRHGRREWAYRPVIRVALALFRLFGFRFDIRGTETIPRHGGAVLAANHVSYLDFMFVGLPAHRRGRRLVRFLAKKSVFDHPVSGPLMRAMGHIPVDRAAGAAAYRDAVAALRAGELIGVFPESTISRALVPRALKSGAARMAQQAGVPLIPVVVWGGQRIWTAGRRPHLRRRLPIYVWVDAPLPCDADDTPESLTIALGVRLNAMVDAILERYPVETGSPAWWLPAAAGGTAPTPQQAAAADLAAITGERTRR